MSDKLTDKDKNGEETIKPPKKTTQTPIPKATIRRIMQTATAKQISENALSGMISLLETACREITKESGQREGQRRIMDYDLETGEKRWHNKKLGNILQSLTGDLSRLAEKVEYLINELGV